jgi:prolyl-tRNA synthetase
LGLKAAPMRADTGPIGGDLSHEFIILAETGESQVYCDRELLDMGPPGPDIDWEGDLQPLVDARTRLYAATDEMHDAARFEAETPEGRRLTARGIEVGHIFYFGEKYSAPMKCLLAGADGVERPAHMGSYGIGVSRLVGAVIEACHDEAGIIWPDAVAPFDVAIINLKTGDPACDSACEKAYAALQAAGRDPLYDDTQERPGAKFSTMDLIGAPRQLIVGPKGLEKGLVEIKTRATGAKSELPLDKALELLAARNG